MFYVVKQDGIGTRILYVCTYTIPYAVISVMECILS